MPQKNRAPRGPVSRRSASVIATEVVVMMMVVVMPMASDHDHGSTTPMAVMVMVMVVVVMVLGELDVCVGGRGLTFVDDLQDRRGIRDRLQQVGVGIGLQRIRRGTDVGAACAAVIVLRAATAPNSPAIFFSMMSLQMPSAHPRVEHKREKVAICSMMEEVCRHVWPQRPR